MRYGLFQALLKMCHSVGYAVKNSTAATPTKFDGGLTDSQRRRRHKNSTRRVDEIRRRWGIEGSITEEVGAL
jgi:hypothetical protein